MITILIIFGIFIITAFYSGFYFGYTKREGKPPEGMPIVSEVSSFIETVKPKPFKKPTQEEIRANNFFD